MNIRLVLSLSTFAVTAAVAQDRSARESFPFVKGRYWLYDGTVRFVKDGEVQEKKITGWKSEVVDFVEGKDFKAALLKGSPADLAWYQEGKERGDVMVVLKGNGEFLRISDGRKSFAKIKQAGKLPAGLSTEREVIFKAPMKVGDRFGDPEQIKLSSRYCWVVSNVWKQKLEPAVKGVPADKEFTTYCLIFMTNPDRTQWNFTSGVGFSFFQYNHHGTPGNCEVQLVETGGTGAKQTTPQPRSGGR